MCIRDRTERGLKVSKSKLRMKEADPKYRDYEDTQVIDSNPKQGAKVKVGTTCLLYTSTAKAYGRFREAGVMIKMDDVAAGIAKSKEEKDNVEKRLD